MAIPTDKNIRAVSYNGTNIPLGGAVDSVNGKTGDVVLTAEDVHALPDDTAIPSEVTESTVSGWGFTKNTGTYSKPSGGIPKSDLASAVKTSLEKADSALQSVPSGYATEAYVDSHHDDTKQDAISDLATIRDNAAAGASKVSCTDATVGGFGYTKNTGTYSKPSGGIPKSDLVSAVQTSLGRADTALQSFTETDPVFAASAAHGITSSDITTWNGKASKPKTASVTLDTTWTESGGNFTKSVSISGATANSKIDCQPDATVIAQLMEDGVAALYFSNNNGTVSAVAVGAMPTASMTVQVTITEVTT